MTIGDRIRRTREAAGMKQSELADRIHTPRQNMYKYETGKITNIPSDKIEAIAAALDVTPEYLMGWEPLPNGDTDAAFWQHMELYSRLDEEDRAEIDDIIRLKLSKGKYQKEASAIS